MKYFAEQVIKLDKEIYPHKDITEKIKASKNFIDKHFSENITVSELASKAYISRFHFIRLFKKYYGQTPNQYLQEVRITKAKKLLLKNITVEKVCTSVGFESKTTFVTLFKKMTGKTPVAYRSKKAILKND